MVANCWSARNWLRITIVIDCSEQRCGFRPGFQRDIPFIGRTATQIKFPQIALQIPGINKIRYAVAINVDRHGRSEAISRACNPGINGLQQLAVGQINDKQFYVVAGIIAVAKNGNPLITRRETRNGGRTHRDTQFIGIAAGG